MQLRRRRLVGYIAAVVCASAAAGCGQKGPLYFPEDRLEKKKKAESAALEPKRSASSNSPTPA